MPMGFTTAAIVAEQRQELIKVTTGCKELDDILEGTSTSSHVLTAGRQSLLGCKQCDHVK